MDDPNVYKEIGQLQAKVESLEKGQDAMNARQDATNAKLDVLLERSAKAAGARGMLWKVGGSSATGGGLLVAILQWLTSRGTP